MKLENSNGTISNWQGDSGKGHVANYVADVDTLEWVPQTNSAATGGGTSDATAANQVTGNSYLQSIDSKTPASPATSAKQDTGNTSLVSIDTKLNSQATAANQTTINTSVGSLVNKFQPIATADYVSRSVASNVETWTYKSGGSGGSTVRTITVTYTDSTLTTISSVAVT